MLCAVGVCEVDVCVVVDGCRMCCVVCSCGMCWCVYEGVYYIVCVDGVCMWGFIALCVVVICVVMCV